MKRWRSVLVLLGLVAAVRPAAGDEWDALSRARELYNQAHYQAAISAADEARRQPALADRADLVAARAFLEKYRESASDDDLSSARIRLRRLDPQRFTDRERSELIVGFGEALYYERDYGAAADTFRTVVDGPVDVPDRERVLDWWASALERDAAPRPDLDRQAVYQRIRDRMRAELLVHPGSGAAAYWIAAAARGAGDLQGAWESAKAGWVRATLAPDHGAALRADLDRLVRRAIIPDRAKALAQPADALVAAWDQFKEQWSK
ncbi:MAG: hypothetical protein ACM3SQ_05475 [Betaproteobacteria bacterium]